MDFWSQMERPGPAEAVVDGVRLARGSRVRLRPRSSADIFDLALAGRVGVIDSIEQDDGGVLHFAVTLDDDPGRDLRELHRFFYAAEELEPVGESGPRVLVAGIGNVFLGDDGFGVEVVRRLTGADLPVGRVDVVDFGIRGLDLAYALQRDYDGVVFVDAAPRGEPPGTLTVLEPELPEPGTAVETHGMDPVKVLALARELGRLPERVLVVCCEPSAQDADDVLVELSEPVLAAVDEAVRLVKDLVMDMITESA
ncbi:hydrogenase maturation protease [Nonomuraea pusilla]|uniref:hydrogenase maturation protease n=1 Tax=Nonomuraea pusilla TaxID=46177 RepID=UPI0033247924